MKCEILEEFIGMSDIPRYGEIVPFFKSREGLSSIISGKLQTFHPFGIYEFVVDEFLCKRSIPIVTPPPAVTTIP